MNKSHIYPCPLWASIQTRSSIRVLVQRYLSYKSLSECSCTCIDRQPDWIIMQLCVTQQSHEGVPGPWHTAKQHYSRTVMCCILRIINSLKSASESRRTNGVISKLVYTYMVVQKFIPCFIWSLHESWVNQNDFVIEVTFTDPPAVTDALLAVWPLLRRNVSTNSSSEGHQRQ